ncbi:hypothetical protein TNCT_321701, partial [Trichonephila clavata]
VLDSQSISIIIIGKRKIKFNKNAERE